MYKMINVSNCSVVNIKGGLIVAVSTDAGRRQPMRKRPLITSIIGHNFNNELINLLDEL